MTASSGRRLALNLAAGGAASFIKGMAQLVMLPVMGRLLGPTEFGLYATVLPIAAFFFVVADGGLATSLAKDKTNDPAVWSTAFYVVMALGICLTALTILCGSGLAHFMHDPKLFYLTAVLAVNFLLIAVSALPSARLVRQNDLVSPAVIEVVAVLFGALLAVVLALRGFGAFSLAFQSVGITGVRAVGLNLKAFEPPNRLFLPTALVDHFNTGGAILGSRLADMVCRMGENIVFASSFNATALGAFTFANQASRFLCESVSNPVWSATYAHTLKLRQSDYADLLSKMIQMMCAATFPVAGLILVASPEVVPFVLGDKWRNAIPYIQILMPSYAIVVSTSICSAVFLTTGRNKGVIWTSGSMSAGRFLMVCAGPWIGSTGTVWAVACVQVVCALFMIGAAVRWYSISVAQLQRMIKPPFIAALAGSCMCFGLLRCLPHTSQYVGLSLALGCLAVIVTFALFRSELLFVDRRLLSFQWSRFLRSPRLNQTILVAGDEGGPKGL